MKFKLSLLATALLAGGLPLATRAQSEPADQNFGAEKSVVPYNQIEIKNPQGETLGRIKDLGLDLVNGRIVEVLVVSGAILDLGGRVVAVPPQALSPDRQNKIYLLNMGATQFASAPEIDLSKWVDAGQSERVAAAYRYFGQEPYFLEAGAASAILDKRVKVSLGYIERSSKIVGLPVGNPQGDSFGLVASLTVDIPLGRILSVIVVAPDPAKTKSVIPAMALSFNASRDALLLNDTKEEYAAEPRYVSTAAAFGNQAHSKEEAYEGPRTTVPLEQGGGFIDRDRTAKINQGIQKSRISARHVEVGTINGRITLRGWVNTEEDKGHLNEIAIAASSLELVDNQITVGKPAAPDDSARR